MHKLPTVLQTSRKGIEFLGRLSSAWSHSELSALSSSARSGVQSDELKTTIQSLDLPLKVLEDRKSCILNYGLAVTTPSTAVTLSEEEKKARKEADGADRRGMADRIFQNIHSLP